MSDVVVGIEVVRRGRVRVRVMAKMMGVVRWRESMVGWGCLDDVL